MLESRHYRRQVEDEQVRAQQMGAHGTPFIVIDGKYGIAGGVDTPALVRTMDRVWAETRPVLSMPFGEGDQCRVGGGCAS